MNEFAYLRVKEVNPFGAFLDWGLEKDLLVPFREQTNKLEEDKSTGFDSDSIKFKVSGYADGKPVFGNAFGKFDVTGL